MPKIYMVNVYLCSKAKGRDEPGLVVLFLLHHVPQLSLKQVSDYAAGCAYCRK